MHATPGQHLVPLSAQVVYPYKPVAFEQNSSLIPFSNTTSESTLVVNVLQPLRPDEQLKQFLENWFNPLTGVYQTMSGIIGGVSGYLIGRINSRKSKK